MNGFSEGELASQALVVGSAVIMLNTIPFIFWIFKGYNLIKSDDDFNIFWYILKIYFFQYLIVTGIYYFVEIIEVMDEGSNLVKLRGSGGAFELFWNSDISSLIAQAQSSNNPSLETAYYYIKWIREGFTMFISLVILFIGLFGVIGGYSMGKKAIKSSYGENEVTDDVLTLFLYTAGTFIAGLFLTFLYSEITQDSYFSGKVILDITSEWWNKVLRQ